jgi:hypothetical protein
LPVPQQIQYGNGTLALRGLKVQLPHNASPEDAFAARELATALSTLAGAAIPVADASAPEHLIRLRRTGAVDALPIPGETAGPNSREAYSLKVTAAGVEIEGKSSAAVYYGTQTLAQLVEGRGANARLPEVTLHDWPVLPYRGVMMDTSHGGLPTEKEIKRHLDFLARWKNNQYYFYSEASIALDGFPILSPEAQFSPAEIRRIVAYARERHIDVVPCMELYGHLHDLFRTERFADLAIVPHGGEFDPRNPRVAEVLKSWVAQLVALFPSKFFHVGMDETWEAPVIAETQKTTAAELYMQQFQLVSSIVRGHGKTLEVWSDMFTAYPNLIPQIPAGTIIVPWGYDRTVYEPYWKPFEDSPLPRFVATGVNVWVQVAPNLELSFDNIDAFLGRGRAHGVTGIINTVWTDDIAVLLKPSFPGLAYGAVAAWQTPPIDRKTFLPEYAQIMYGPAAAADAAAGLAAADRAENALATVVSGKHFNGEQTSPSFWDDPLEPAHLARATAQYENFRQCRLQAEDAIEHLTLAVRKGADPTTLSDILLEARLLDYAGMKNIYAAEFAQFWQTLGPHPDRRHVGFYLSGESSSRDHSRIQDMVDLSGDLQEAYRAAWLDSFTSYRLGGVMDRWTGESQYWWNLDRRFHDFARGFKDGDTLPPLESFSPRRQGQ